MRTLARAALVVLIPVAIAAVVWWWLTIYDTAGGRCQRGDFGACIVYEAQHTTRPVQDILDSVGQSI